MEDSDNKFPKQTRFIVGNEACERFSFYGMRSILALYMTSVLLMDKDTATEAIHLFLAAIYLMPLLGGWVSDRFLGRYNTILYVSLFYCLGHTILAMSELGTSIESKKWIMFSGMALIAFGSGGIKPCVSAFMGDQFKPEQKHLLPKAYAAFYWSINLGSFAAFLIIPEVQKEYGWACAFVIPGITMALATIVFWSGRHKYVRVPPQEKKDSSGLLSIYLHCLKNKTKGVNFYASAYETFPQEDVDNLKSIVRILKLFALVPPFWALYDQTASSWVLQGHQMEAFSIGKKVIKPEQIQAANPVFVMILIPFLTMVVYPRVKFLSNPLRRMSAGMLISGFAFGIVGFYQWYLEGDNSLNLAYQLLPYLVLTVSEILISTTGLEFAFTQAPAKMKSMVTSFWNMTIFLGNMLVVGITRIFGDGSGESAVTSERFFIYGIMVCVVFFAFSFVASRYKMTREDGVK